MSDWNDHVVGDRMAVDQEFNSRVQGSSFTNQEWSLIMTATEFEIEAPGSDRARIVANTEKLPQMMPELDNVRKQMPTPADQREKNSSVSGVVQNIRDALGLGSSDEVDEERLAEARSLTQEYATEFQRHLEQQGKWERVQELSAEGGSDESAESESDDLSDQGGEENATDGE